MLKDGSAEDNVSMPSQSLGFGGLAGLNVNIANLTGDQIQAQAQLLAERNRKLKEKQERKLQKKKSKE